MSDPGCWAGPLESAWKGGAGAGEQTQPGLTELFVFFKLKYS